MSKRRGLTTPELRSFETTSANETVPSPGMRRASGRSKLSATSERLAPRLGKRWRSVGFAWPICFVALAGCGSEAPGPTQGFGEPGPAPGPVPGNPTPVTPGELPAPTPADTDVIVGGLPPGTVPPGVDEADCDNVLEVTYRDFTEDHPDFEMPFSGDEVRLTLLEPQLDAEGKPVFRDSIGCPWSQTNPHVCADWTPTQKVIESKASFDQWYRTVPGVNQEFQKDLVLTETPAGSGNYVYESNEFFPLGPQEGFGTTPRNGQNRNYLFTTEIHLTFTYKAGQTFSFRGDDDLWIFINDKLALDLGSMHNPAEGVIDFDAQASELGIVPNRVYRMDVFHAERHTQVSSFRIQTNIGCFTPGPPRTPR